MKAIRCKCGCIYPNDMTSCPSCQSPTECNEHHVLTDTKKNRGKSSNPSSWKPVKAQTPRTYQPSNALLTLCQACGKEISIKASLCQHCGHPTGILACPKCGSIKTKTISETSKAIAIFLWGRFATNKVLSKYQCMDCGHKF